MTQPPTAAKDLCTGPCLPAESKPEDAVAAAAGKSAAILSAPVDTTKATDPFPMKRVLLGGACLILSLWAAQVRWNVRHTLCVLVMQHMICNILSSESARDGLHQTGFASQSSWGHALQKHGSIVKPCLSTPSRHSGMMPLWQLSQNLKFKS
jgi:hypothetical protein